MVIIIIIIIIRPVVSRILQSDWSEYGIRAAYSEQYSFSVQTLQVSPSEDCPSLQVDTETSLTPDDLISYLHSVEEET